MMYEEKICVVTVCGNEAFTYGLPDALGYRQLLARQVFSNYGQARQFAVSYEDKQRSKRKPDVDVLVKRKSRKSMEPNKEQS
jgi:hypothetical protein